MKVAVHDSIAEIDSAAWNALAGADYPFLRHEFLELAETTGSVSDGTSVPTLADQFLQNVDFVAMRLFRFTEEFDYVCWFGGLEAGVATEPTSWSRIKALYAGD